MSIKKKLNPFKLGEARVGDEAVAFGNMGLVYRGAVDEVGKVYSFGEMQVQTISLKLDPSRSGGFFSFEGHVGTQGSEIFHP